MIFITMAGTEYFRTIILILILLDILVVSGLNLSLDSAARSIGERLFVRCKDDGGSSVEWKGPKGKLGTKTHPKVQIHSYGTGLIFDTIKKDDFGEYTCSISASPHVKETFTLTEAVAWEFVDTPKEQSANEGDDKAVIRCLSNRKDIAISWVLEGGGSLTGKKYRTIADGLSIFNITRNDSNIYECQGVHTKSGTRNVQKIKFVVKHKPYSVFAQDLPVYAYLNQKINLTCEVEAEPAPKFQWLFNKNIKNYGRITNISSHISVLELVMKNETQAKYQCIASNEFGESRKIFDVYLGVQPNPPLDVQLENSTSDTFKLKIELPDESNNTQNNTMVPRWLVIFYKTQNETDWHDQEFDVGNFSTVTVDVTGLQSSTKYEIRVATRNLAGLSDYTNSTFFETSSSSSICSHVKSIFLYIFIGYLISLSQNLRLA